MYLANVASHAAVRASGARFAADYSWPRRGGDAGERPSRHFQPREKSSISSYIERVLHATLFFPFRFWSNVVKSGGHFDFMPIARLMSRGYVQT